MTQRQHQLLRLLKTASAPLTSAFLGGRLGVSARSIMNDVAAINSAASGTILASKDGYVLNRAARNSKEGEHAALASSAAHTQEERIHYLVWSVLLGENERVKLYRLADHLHVSLDSIKKDIAELQRGLCSTSLTLRTVAGHLELSGDEADKRNLLSESVTEYLSRARLSAEGLQSVFRWFSVKSLQETLLEATRKQEMFVNDSLLPNLLRDVLVAVSRIRLGHRLADADDADKIHPAVIKTAERISQTCKIGLSSGECAHLQQILFSYWLPGDFRNMSYGQLMSMLPAETGQVWTCSLAWLMKEYPFLEVTERFRVRMALNLHNILQRKAMKRRTLNMQREDMKHASPFAFCLAMNLCGEMSRLTEWQFTEDEAGSLSIHIGLMLQSQRHARWETVACGLLIPPYFDYECELRNQIMEHFQKDIHILADLNAERDASILKCAQLVISTLPMPDSFPVDWIVANPLLSRPNIQEIACHIERKKKENRRKFLRQFLLEHGSVGPLPVKVHGDAPHWILFRHIAVCLFVSATAKTSHITIQAAKTPKHFQGKRVEAFCHVLLQPWEWQAVSYVLDIMVECLLSFQKIPWDKLTDMEKFIGQLEKAEPLADLPGC